MALVKHYKELRVHKQAFAAVSRIYTLSKHWPKEERYSLTDQIRRSSRSVCANIAEAWHKRRYPAHFISKLSDSDSEAAETEVWLDFALDCGYISQQVHNELYNTYENVIGGLVNMMANPDAWCGPSRLRDPSPAYNSHTHTLPHADSPTLPHSTDEERQCAS
jgi:four helix bundle protein